MLIVEDSGSQERKILVNQETGYGEKPILIEDAGIAQLVEQLIRNQQVVCSSHIASSKRSYFNGYDRFCCF